MNVKTLPSLIKTILATIGSLMALYAVSGPVIQTFLPPNVAMTIAGIAVFLTAVLHNATPITDLAGVIAGTVPFQTFLDDLKGTLEQNNAQTATTVQAAVQTGIAAAIPPAQVTVVTSQPAPGMDAGSVLLAGQAQTEG